MELYLDLSSHEASLAAKGMRQLIEKESNPEIKSALNKVLAVVANAAGVSESRAEKHAGYIDWTLQDESFEPSGRDFEVRVFFDWVDRGIGDSVTPSFGGYAEIADIEIIGVRYYDAHENLISAAQHHVEAAWQLLANDSGRIEDACTQAGKSAGVDSLYQATSQTSIQRLAPSVRQRSAEDQRRAMG